MEGVHMKKTRRHYDHELKASVVDELENGKPVTQIAREKSLLLSLPSGWRDELVENPEIALIAMETITKIMLRLPNWRPAGKGPC
jgi:transposase-like protein